MVVLQLLSFTVYFVDCFVGNLSEAYVQQNYDKLDETPYIIANEHVVGTSKNVRVRMFIFSSDHSSAGTETCKITFLRVQKQAVDESIELNLTNHGILHYLCSADLLKSFSQLIVSIFIFSQYFFQ